MAEVRWWDGSAGTVSLIKAYKSNLPCVGNAERLSKSSWHTLGAHNYSLLWTPVSRVLGLPGGLRPWFLLEDRRTHSKAPEAIMPETRAQGCWGVCLPRWVVLQTQVGGESSHNWPGNRSRNEMLLTLSQRRYSCPFNSRKKKRSGVGSWDSGGWEHRVGLPRMSGCWVFYFLSWALIPLVCLLHENAQSSAFDICAQPIWVKFLKQSLLEEKIKDHIVWPEQQTLRQGLCLSQLTVSFLTSIAWATKRVHSPSHATSCTTAHDVWIWWEWAAFGEE